MRNRFLFTTSFHVLRRDTVGWEENLLTPKKQLKWNEYIGTGSLQTSGVKRTCYPSQLIGGENGLPLIGSTFGLFSPSKPTATFGLSSAVLLPLPCGSPPLRWAQISRSYNKRLKIRWDLKSYQLPINTSRLRVRLNLRTGILALQAFRTSQGSYSVPSATLSGGKNNEVYI